MMRFKCIRVNKKYAQRVIDILRKKNLLPSFKLKKYGEFVLIPIKNGDIPDFEFEYSVEFSEFEPVRKPEPIKARFDVVGDIAIIKFAEGMDVEKIATAILKNHKNIKKVAVDYGVKGETRVRSLKLIYGESFETIHREYGIRIKVDVSKVYFSPRLASERWRVVSQVNDGEIIYDMFCGCGPFSIMIAKYRKVKIFASDINPYAIYYLKENIKLNKITTITPILGDAREVVKSIGKVNRIIMNLPHSAYEFFPYALNAVESGTKIHYYEILKRDASIINGRIVELQKIAEEKGIKLKLIEYHTVHPYSPSSDMYAFLFEII